MVLAGLKRLRGKITTALVKRKFNDVGTIRTGGTWEEIVAHSAELVVVGVLIFLP